MWHEYRPITLRLDYRPPYDWRAMLAFLASRAIPGIESCDTESYTRTILLEDQQGYLRVHNDETKNTLVAQLAITGPVDLVLLVPRLRSMFDLDADPDAIQAVLSADARLAPLLARIPGLRLPGCWDPFELVIRAILGQQITVTAARTIATRLVARYGQPLGADHETPFNHEPSLFPDCQTLAEADIHNIGIPGRRAATLRLLSDAVANGAVNFDPPIDGQRLERQLLAIAGIGKWTVAYVQLRALKDPDIFPSGDVALLRAAQSLGIAQTQPQLQRASQDWHPWRTYAVAHLWRSLAQPSPP